jgi:hypothetical protein
MFKPPRPPSGSTFEFGKFPVMTYGFSAVFREDPKYFQEPEIRLHISGGNFYD